MIPFKNFSERVYARLQRSFWEKFSYGKNELFLNFGGVRERDGRFADILKHHLKGTA